MKTKKQQELIDSLLAKVGDKLAPLYRDIYNCLSDHGYNPHKQRSYIVFKHDEHNKQIAKTGIRINKDKAPFFALRFSACRGYSKRFDDIVRNLIATEGEHFMNGGCPNGGCDYCAGKAETHIYICTFPDGTTRSHCGAVALEIPNITKSDIPEIKKLIKEEHEYLMKHEAVR